MSGTVSYELDGPVAIVTMDDGKVNALSPAMLVELDRAFARAESDGAVVVLSGRPGVFSAGFDLGVLRGGGPDGWSMLGAGFALAERMLSFPTPIVLACPGHAIAMGVFLVLCADYRIAADGPFKLTANEVAIGMTLPRAAIEICRQRLTPAAFNRAVLLAEPFSPHEAMSAGFVDRVVAADDLAATARSVAEQLATLDLAAHAASKARLRLSALQALRRAIEEDGLDTTG